MRLFLVIISLFSFMSKPCIAQSLTTHQWQNRLLIVITDDITNASYQKQLTHLQLHKEALTERKLLIYKVFPNQYIKGIENTQSQSSNDLYKKYNSKSLSFKVILIGLDGSIKLKQTEPVSIEKLKGIIDAMPMRILEMRKEENE